MHAAATEDAVVKTVKPDNHNMTPEAKKPHKEKKHGRKWARHDKMKGKTPEEKKAHKEERRARKAAHHKS